MSFDPGTRFRDPFRTPNFLPGLLVYRGNRRGRLRRIVADYGCMQRVGIMRCPTNPTSDGSAESREKNGLKKMSLVHEFAVRFPPNSPKSNLKRFIPHSFLLSRSFLSISSCTLIICLTSIRLKARALHPDGREKRGSEGEVERHPLMDGIAYRLQASADENIKRLKNARSHMAHREKLEKSHNS